jgi:hypothetical protein
MTRTISSAAALSLAVLLGGCSFLSFGGESTPVSGAPPARPPADQLQAACEALRPNLPMAYHYSAAPGGVRDTLDTIERIRTLNARFAAACP